MVADLCCGHGFTGILFAIFEPEVEKVILVDRTQPPSYRKVMDCVAEVAPWAGEKVEYRETTLAQGGDALPREASLLGVHACGARTDRILELVSRHRSRFAVMPCCYAQTAKRAPRGLANALSPNLITDIDRTYRMEALDFAVEWSAIPRAITPMNRILIGQPRSPALDG
jgi:hypothetical protein